MEVAGKRVAGEEDNSIKEIETACEPCKNENIATAANGICRDCDEYMCSTCFQHHLKAKQCRNHVLMDTQGVSSQAHKSAGNVEKCQHHANEQIKFYCRTHDIVGCGECMIPDHRGCNTENIKGLTNGFVANEDFKRLMKKLDELEISVTKNETKIQENRKANKSMYESALKDIRTFRTEVNTYLDNAEECIAKEVKDIENHNSKLLTKLEHDCQLLSSKMNEVKQKMDAELYPETALFIQTVNCKPIIHDIERAVSKSQRENSIREFEFIPDKQLQSLINSMKNFGNISIPMHRESASVESIEISDERVDDSVAKDVYVKRQELGSPATVAVGSRVRAKTNSLLTKVEYRRHRGLPGTVTEVHPDGNVVVRWDKTGTTWTYHSSTVYLI